MITDWKSFLTAHRVEWRDHGPNVARGNIVVRCPWCGNADESGHLGINLRTGEWGCWRSRQHRGRSAVRLIQALLNCGLPEAIRLAGARGGASLEPDAAFGAAVATMLGKGPAPEAEVELAWPERIKPLAVAERSPPRPCPAMVPIWDYLRYRGYNSYEINRAASIYDLHYAISGSFAFRVIFPVYEAERGLVTWTGRSTDPYAMVRYKTLSADPEKAKADNMPRAKGPISDFLFNQAELQFIDHEAGLVVSEGPFDAMKLDFYGDEHGVRATCLFTKSISSAQLETLCDLAPKFDHKVLLLDRDATVDAFALREAAVLESLGFRTMSLMTVKDPGEMSPRQVSEFCQLLLSGQRGYV